MGTSGGETKTGRAAAMLLATPLGWVWAAAVAGKLVGLSLSRGTRDQAEKEAARLGEIGRPDALLRALSADLERYFAGAAVDVRTYPVDVSDQPAFRRRALLAATEIARGETRTYGWLAARAGSPGGARAAGQAMAHNPIGLVIPCHRVVAGNGRLGGFGGGPAMKRALLELEGVEFHGERLAR